MCTLLLETEKNKVEVLTEADDGAGVGGSLIGISNCVRAEISGCGDGHFASGRLCR